MNKSSILCAVSKSHNNSLVRLVCVPLLGHHQKTLHQKALDNLGPNSLEETQRSLSVKNEAHDFSKALEWLAFPARRRTRLKTNLGDNQGLGRNCRQRL